VNVRKILVLALALAVLLAAIFLVDRRERARRSAQGTLLDLAAEAVERLELRNARGVFAFARGEAGWRLEKPMAAAADKATVEGILDNFCPLKYDRLIAERGAELTDFGLDRPEIELKLFARGRQPATVLLGTKNAIDDSTYAKLADGERVAAIAGYRRNDLEKDLFAFRDKKFFAIDPAAVTAVEIRSAERSLALAKKQERWFLERPLRSLARAEKVADLVSSASLLEATAFLPLAGDGARAGFGLDRPLITAEFTTPLGRRRIEIGRAGGSTYALADGSTEVCAIAGDFADRFAGTADDWRERKAARFYAFDVRELSVRQGAFQAELRRDDAGAWAFAGPAAGRSPDEEKINALLTALAELEAASFIDEPGLLAGITRQGTVARVVLKSEDPAQPGKRSELALEFYPAEGDEAVVRDPSLAYAFRVGRGILAKLPAKIDDIASSSSPDGPPPPTAGR
jgi:hypothetical protein